VTKLPEEELEDEELEEVLPEDELLEDELDELLDEELDELELTSDPFGENTANPPMVPLSVIVSSSISRLPSLTSTPSTS